MSASHAADGMVIDERLVVLHAETKCSAFFQYSGVENVGLGLGLDGFHPCLEQRLSEDPMSTEHDQLVARGAACFEHLVDALEGVLGPHGQWWSSTPFEVVLERPVPQLGVQLVEQHVVSGVQFRQLDGLGPCFVLHGLDRAEHV